MKKGDFESRVMISVGKFLCTIFASGPRTNFVKSNEKDCQLMFEILSGFLNFIENLVDNFIILL